MDELVRVARGVWRAPSAVDDFPALCAALLQAMPPGTVIGGLSAARLHGLWLPDDRHRRVEVIIRGDPALPRQIAGSRRAEVRARRRTLHPRDIASRDGVPLTSVACTWCDLASPLSMADLVAAGDSALRSGCDVDALRDALHRAFRRRGVVKARTALPLLDARSRSRPESHLRYALVSTGLPSPEVNAPIFSERGEWLAEPDLHYKAARLALEYNGAEHADPSRMRHDITRDLDYQWADWRVITFGPKQVFGRPDQVATLVRAVLAERGPQLLGRRPARRSSR
ncbi:MAG TPA: hypothetical protein VE074_10100 [Jatrophihabitantaceae bacterium]|nr:hypothetical protein [Jatrophihabitantaceae bacterium]